MRLTTSAEFLRSLTYANDDSALAKRYTITLKDELLPRNPENGREQSTVSWEYDFKISSSRSQVADEEHVLEIPWASFKPTFRGKEKKDPAPLNLSGVKRLSFLMRR